MVETDALIPESLRALMAGRAADGAGLPDGEAWLRSVPKTLETLLGTWRLTPDGPSMHGQCALVVPVRRGSERLALKLA